MVGKARFSTWTTPTKAEFREAELFLLPQICWLSPRTTVPKQGVSDGNAQIGNGCKEPAVRKHLDVLGPTRKNKPAWSLPCWDAAGICGPSKPAGMVWLPVAKLPWQPAAVQCWPGQPTLATKALLRLSSCCSTGHSPTHCSELFWSQQVTVPQEPPLPLQAQSKIDYCLCFFLHLFTFFKNQFCVYEDSHQFIRGQH